MIDEILNSGIELSVTDAGKLRFKGDAETVNRWKPALRQWKLELIKILTGDTVGDVGQCDDCSAGLIGLPVSGGYVNRVCPACGTWHRCIEPPAKRARPVCTKPPESLFSKSGR